MDDIANDPGLVLNAFWVTIQLAVLSGLASLVLGTLLAAMRVGPVGVLAKFGTVYVSVVRNTPLLLIFVLVFIAAPTLDLLVKTPFLVKGVIALTIYTSAFVCEAIRSGINSVSLGQAEASGGTVARKAWGSTTWDIVAPKVRPIARAASACPSDTELMPERIASQTKAEV